MFLVCRAVGIAAGVANQTAPVGIIAARERGGRNSRLPPNEVAEGFVDGNRRDRDQCQDDDLLGHALTALSACCHECLLWCGEALNAASDASSGRQNAVNHLKCNWCVQPML
jgi:hypothetical protein